MKIHKITLFGHGMSSNCYILEKNNEAVVFDPGFEHNNLYSFLENNNLDVVKIILTHGHFDHWGGLKKLKEKYPNAKTYASSLEEIWFNDPNLNINSFTPTFDYDLNTFNEIKLFDENIKLIKVPGHSQGSIAFYFKSINTLISGDVLFFESIGRTDLPGGNYNQLIHSVSNLFSILDDDTKVLSGHGRPTTIGHEKKFNPFLK